MLYGERSKQRRRIFYLCYIQITNSDNARLLTHKASKNKQCEFCKIPTSRSNHFIRLEAELSEDNMENLSKTKIRLGLVKEWLTKHWLEYNWKYITKRWANILQCLKRVKLSNKSDFGIWMQSCEMREWWRPSLE